MNSPSDKKSFWSSIELSALFTIIGIILLFSGAVIVTLIAPSLIDSTWTQPTTSYQVQMYEVSDPHFFISSSPLSPEELQAVYHLKNNFTLLAFQESETIKISAPQELEKYVTRYKDPTLKLTSKLLLLRRPQAQNNKAKENQVVLELYDPEKEEAFALAPTQGILENWVDKDYTLLDPLPKHYPVDANGFVFVNNPLEYLVRHYEELGKKAGATIQEGSQ